MPEEKNVKELIELMGEPRFYGVLGAEFHLFGIQEITTLQNSLWLRMNPEYIIGEAAFAFNKPGLDQDALKEHILRCALVSSLELALEPLSPKTGDFDQYTYRLEEPSLQFRVESPRQVPNDAGLVNIEIRIEELSKPKASDKYSKEVVIAAYARHLQKGIGDPPEDG